VGGDSLIKKAIPPIYAIPTTAGTGSEVGRSGVVILRDTGRKHIFFHPDLMPRIAVLEPELTAGMPPWLTASTGMDAFIHSLEAYFVDMFHPMADGIALEGMELVLKWLPLAIKDGNDLEAREKMQIAAAMGAVAFQKGLGMIHSLAHPLSSRCGLHHGLANALLLPVAVEFLEKANLNPEQQARIDRVQHLFTACDCGGSTLSESCGIFCEKTGIEFGLSTQGVKLEDLDPLADEAFADPCHNCNLVPVTREDLKSVYKAAM
jgi:alcohol dehydrogenase class IV